MDGVGVKIDKEEIDPATGNKRRERKKVLRKIPAKVLREAQGIIIFSAMRNGIAPFGGSGGTGVIMARLEDGSEFPLVVQTFAVVELQLSQNVRLSPKSKHADPFVFYLFLSGWSAPSFISPNNLTVGLLLGCDFYDSIMSEFNHPRSVLRAQEPDPLLSSFSQFFDQGKLSKLSSR